MLSVIEMVTDSRLPSNRAKLFVTLSVLPVGYKYDLLQVQTRPISSEVRCASADAAALAFDGQHTWDEHRVRTMTDPHLRLRYQYQDESR